VAEGALLALAVMSSHVFWASDELEVKKDVRVVLIFDGKRVDVPVTPNLVAFTFAGSDEHEHAL
jgi:hypothetical protein